MKPPMYFGWKRAKELEDAQLLESGDICQNRDGSLSYWNKGKWIPLHKGA